MSAESLAGTPVPVLDLERLERDSDRLADEYRTASPYPHIVLDDFLEPARRGGGRGVPAARSRPPWNNYLHINERKFSNTDPETWGPTLQADPRAAQLPPLRPFVEKLIGVEGLVADPSSREAGSTSRRPGLPQRPRRLHRASPQPQVQRRANILLYLNPDWKPEYGGDLEFWSPDMKECVKKVSPVANRVLIFSTDQDSFHGHPDR